MNIMRSLGRYHPAKAYTSGKAVRGKLEDIIQQLKPVKPLYALFPDIVEGAAQHFLAAFPGKPLYAVKTNPDPQVLQALMRGGMRAFDVASLEEIRLVKSLMPEAELHFMHTIKAPEDIRAAYFEFGVRHFVLDHEDELFKIMRETDLAQDLHLIVRLALPKNDGAFIDFSAKFGAQATEAMELLKKCRPVARSLGVSFHVGTQTAEAQKYATAIAHAANIIHQSDIQIDSLNVGGGFPVSYGEDDPVCSVEECVTAIQDALLEHRLSHLPLYAEPGRVLVARGMKLIARVELRKNDVLYINDGVYGGLFDACAWLGLKYPVSAVSCDTPHTATVQPFRLAGPTCDSLDMMNGPFMLPGDIGNGDWVVFDNAGAYSQALRSNFNGFGYAGTISVIESKE